MSGVPIIDLDATDAVEQVAAACESVGFFSVIGHRIDPAVIDDARVMARRFFDLPLTDRQAVAMPAPGYPYGWSPLAGETLARSLGHESDPDVKQSYAIGPVDPPPHRLTDPAEAIAWSANLWPASIPELRPAWERYYRTMAALASRLLSMMAVALDLPADHFEPLIDRHTSAMRALDYPGRAEVAAAGVDADERLGAGAHTDYGTLTVLLADDGVPGLQVLGPDGAWIDVIPEPGALVVNLGDAMERWTNDRWRSTLHRVIVPPERRQSIAFFHNANWDAVIECLPACLGAGESPRYRPIQAGPHLMDKFRATVV